MSQKIAPREYGVSHLRPRSVAQMSRSQSEVKLIKWNVCQCLCCNSFLHGWILKYR